MGAVGMFSQTIFQPITGRWIDNDLEEVAARGLTGDELELVAGQQTMATITIFPIILIVLFTILFFWVRSMKDKTKAEAQAS